jgi:hypothetical protein
MVFLNSLGLCRRTAQLKVPVRMASESGRHFRAVLVLAEPLPGFGTGAWLLTYFFILARACMFFAFTCVE